MIDTARKCLRLVDSGTHGRWVLVIVLAVVVSVMEAVGGLLVFMLVGLVTGSESALQLPVIGDVARFFPQRERSELVLWTTGVIAGFFIVRAAVVLAQGYVSNRVAEGAGARLSNRLARGYLYLPYPLHLRRASAELIRNSFDTVQRLVQMVFVQGVQLIAQTLITVGLLVVLLITTPLAALMALGILLPMLFVLLRIIHPRLKRFGAAGQRDARRSLQTLQESLQGARDIKILGKEEAFAERFATSRDALARSRYLRGALVQVPYVATETALIFTVVAIFVTAVVRGGGALNALPALGLFAYAGLRLKPSLTAVVASLNSLRYSGPAIDEVYEDLLLCTPYIPEAGLAPVERLPFKRDITIDHVTFCHDGAATPSLQDVSLRIPAGAWVGVVGPTGGGKSTLIDVISGLLDPTEGRVSVDGVDIRGRVREWQANIGVVPQTLFLIDDTMRRNIALGDRDEDTDENALADSIRLAQLDDVVAELPDGLDTVIGERGVRLSGGQLQRLVIARALYRQPNVLIFDEGTSALDTATESQVMAAIESVRAERTVITVAHRLSTVRGCDFIAVITAGRVVDVGPYHELIDRSEGFRRLVQ